jgi:hypothetical protein
VPKVVEATTSQAALASGGFVARTPIQYFNVNVALLARKLDEWGGDAGRGS